MVLAVGRHYDPAVPVRPAAGLVEPVVWTTPSGVRLEGGRVEAQDDPGSPWFVALVLGIALSGLGAVIYQGLAGPPLVTEARLELPPDVLQPAHEPPRAAPPAAKRRHHG